MVDTMSAPIVETAKILPKGQITIPADIRRGLGLDVGDRVMLVWDGKKAVLINPVLHALKWLGEQIGDDAAEAGFNTEEDVAAYITQMRREKRNR